MSIPHAVPSQCSWGSHRLSGNEWGSFKQCLQWVESGNQEWRWSSLSPGIWHPSLLDQGWISCSKCSHWVVSSSYNCKYLFIIPAQFYPLRRTSLISRPILPTTHGQLHSLSHRHELTQHQNVLFIPRPQTELNGTAGHLLVQSTKLNISQISSISLSLTYPNPVNSPI